MEQGTSPHPGPGLFSCTICGNQGGSWKGSRFARALQMWAHTWQCFAMRWACSACILSGLVLPPLRAQSKPCDHAGVLPWLHKLCTVPGFIGFGLGLGKDVTKTSVCPWINSVLITSDTWGQNTTENTSCVTQCTSLLGQWHSPELTNCPEILHLGEGCRVVLQDNEAQSVPGPGFPRESHRVSPFFLPKHAYLPNFLRGFLYFKFPFSWK